MKRTVRTVILIALSLAIMLPASAAFAEMAEPARMINVVYDDSGSMIRMNNQLVDTWCQAKYSMEVFAAMLGGGDTMNIYTMSDYSDGDSGAGPRLTLYGMDGADTNVAKVHAMITTAGNTPFDTVRKANDDLTQASADEKWLVVLTDGEFQGVDDIDAYFAQKSSDVSVMFMGIGPAASSITANEAAGLYSVKAQTNSEILSTVTGICTRIFNSDKLEVSVADKTLEFDVPMGELTVFAQGANVDIGGITDSAGHEYLCSVLPVTVKYSETAATNYPEALVARGLQGSIAIYKDDFPAGEYALDVTGAETIEVYYRPNVEIAAYLTDGDGREVTGFTSLKTGDYTISFGFVKAGTDERVAQSELLGDVTYSAVVTNNGITHERTYTSGDSIHLDEGTLHIDATAQFLEYNTVATSRDYSVYSDKTIEFIVDDTAKYEIIAEGLNAEAPVKISAAIDGREFTDEEWEQMGLPQVTLLTEPEYGFAEPQAVKTAEKGIFEYYPSMSRSLSQEVYDSCDFTVEYIGKSGDSTWSGDADGTLHINDSRTWLERYRDVIIRSLIGLAVFVLLLGYVPGIKKRFPRKMTKTPNIYITSTVRGVPDSNGKGSFKKKWWSVLLPYCAQRAELVYLPTGANGKLLRLKAANKGYAYVINRKDYVNKRDFSIDGQMIDSTKPLKISLGSVIRVERPPKTYTCIPQVEYSPMLRRQY